MNNFWKNRNVLVTGHEGFLGSNLVKRLFVLGAKVVGLDIKVNRKETIFTKDEYRKIAVIKGSVSDYELVKQVIADYKVGIVFHLAAEAIVGRSAKDPLSAFSTNIKGTWDVLEACRHSKRVQAVIIASSDKAYGSHERLPYKEDAHLQGSHPYDVSKSCADLIARAYFHTYDIPVAITRCGNIYGRGDFNFSRIIPDTIRCVLKNRTLFIRSDGKYIRDYVYIDDIVDGYILLAEKIQKLKLGGEAFNFSNENPISVLGLVKIIYSIFGKKPDFKVLNKAKYEIKKQYLSSGKARKVLNWKPRYSLEGGLKEAINWYKDYFKK